MLDNAPVTLYEAWFHLNLIAGVEVEVERLGLGGTKEIVRVTEAEVIYVAVGDDGKPIPV